MVNTSTHLLPDQTGGHVIMIYKGIIVWSIIDYCNITSLPILVECLHHSRSSVWNDLTLSWGHWPHDYQTSLCEEFFNTSSNYFIILNSLYLFVCLYVCLFVCLFTCLFVCLTRRLVWRDTWVLMGSKNDPKITKKKKKKNEENQTFFAEKFWENILTYFQKFSAKIFRFWSKNDRFYKILEIFFEKICENRKFGSVAP